MAQEASKGKNDAPAAAATGAAASGGGGWLPVIVVLVAVPALSFAMAEFVLFPRLEQRLTAAGLHPAGEGGAAPAAAPDAHGEGATTPAAGKGAKGPKAPMQSYEFANVVSNLAGAMKSRYIKVSFTVYGSDLKFLETIEQNRAKLLDTTLGVLGSLNLSEMEDSTVKNKVRISLVQAYQTVLGGRVIEEVYFSEFVIQ